MRGWIKAFTVIGLCTFPYVVFAQDIACQGQDPDWSLSTNGDVADFSFERASELQVMQDDRALNADNTRAMTLVGPRDSAIVVLHEDQKLATVLTQRGQTPVILAGTCD